MCEYWTQNYDQGRIVRTAAPTKKGPQKGAANNVQHPSERVKLIKVTVMSKKISPVFQENINRGDTAELTDGDD